MHWARSGGFSIAVLVRPSCWHGSLGGSPKCRVTTGAGSGHAAHGAARMAPHVRLHLPTQHPQFVGDETILEYYSLAGINAWGWLGIEAAFVAGELRRCCARLAQHVCMPWPSTGQHNAAQCTAAEQCTALCIAAYQRAQLPLYNGAPCAASCVRGFACTCAALPAMPLAGAIRCCSWLALLGPAGRLSPNPRKLLALSPPAPASYHLQFSSCSPSWPSSLCPTCAAEGTRLPLADASTGSATATPHALRRWRCSRRAYRPCHCRWHSRRASHFAMASLDSPFRRGVDCIAAPRPAARATSLPRLPQPQLSVPLILALDSEVCFSSIGFAVGSVHCRRYGATLSFGTSAAVPVLSGDGACRIPSLIALEPCHPLLAPAWPIPPPLL